jgi:hypothetical protein
MYGMNNIKFINARQAKEAPQYKNLRLKIIIRVHLLVECFVLDLNRFQLVKEQ